MPTLDSKIERLLAHPRFDHVAYGLAGGFQAVQVAAPRLASQFSTQQRWLMSHVALSHYFPGRQAGRMGISRRDFTDMAVAHGLASRNTAAAFFDEALHYGIIQARQPAAGGMVGLAEPAPSTLWALGEWFSLHLAALDSLDGGARAARLRGADTSLLAHMEPSVAEGLLSCRALRAPAPIYAIFASVDEGGSLMDRLIAGLDMVDAPHQERAVTNVTSISALARPLNLSRTHAGRTLAAAASLSGLGWSGAPGRSPIWLSRSFRAEYAQVQAAKLAIIGDAFDAATGVAEPERPTALALAEAGGEAWDRPSC
ncbi:MAG TPA: hypothetical protein VGN82_01855 [Bosea sp. (in: a-proteobacteria)]|jgi:hypothetical protein|uniref:hypothetical protein n=1 Tax=Bosea sp. (in: a-proteobacteria) TaxID=1871050 RepID=UPI002E125CD1|nr:hypothetical protein [Bosea sp. (in: a-proteobacteria)]